ncbi:hypothetical protein J2S57_007057 [Kineosporia succinea]|uniref:Uncharacterized protein n=1 Tax=Kineosporia succinea TaxID=84632 RepID=A0ABT9PF19_9ACTN|nr:hypothetical protein [Kineosporia succinea]
MVDDLRTPGGVVAVRWVARAGAVGRRSHIAKG